MVLFYDRLYQRKKVKREVVVNMSSNKDMYISSISETIGVTEQRQLLELSRNVNSMLTLEEFKSIMAIYGKAIDRVLKENNVEEKDEN